MYTQTHMYMPVHDYVYVYTYTKALGSQQNWLKSRTSHMCSAFPNLGGLLKDSPSCLSFPWNPGIFSVPHHTLSKHLQYWLVFLFPGFQPFNTGVLGFHPLHYCRTYWGHSFNYDQKPVWLSSWPSSLNCTEGESSLSLASARRSKHILQTKLWSPTRDSSVWV